MAQGHEQFQPGEPEEIPGKLADDLGRLFGRDLPIPPEIDRVILGEAAERMSRVMRFRRRFVRWAPWAGGAAAAAAVVLIVLRLTAWTGGSRPGQQLVTTPPAGQVTMLDAYRLSAMLDAGQTPDARFDFDHNGRVDRADVEAMAQAAVRISSGGAIQ